MKNTQDSIGEVTQGLMTALQAVAPKYHNDPQFRAQLEASPRTVFAEEGVELPPNGDVRVFANTAEVFHLVLPSDPNILITDKSLGDVSGGGQITPQRSAVSTVATFPSTVSTASSVDAGPLS